MHLFLSQEAKVVMGVLVRQYPAHYSSVYSCCLMKNKFVKLYCVSLRHAMVLFTVPMC